MTVWFDTHSHLQDDDFNEDLQEVLDRARDAGVTRVLLASSEEKDAEKACLLTLQNAMLYAAAGIHPHEASGWSKETAGRLKALIRETNRQAALLGRHKAVVAIGEIGLDFHYDFSPRSIQHAVFRAQLELAKEVDLPVIIHMREATAAMLDVLTSAYKDGLFSKDHPAGVIHCYSGSAETLPALLDLGFMIGFDGRSDFQKRKNPWRPWRRSP